MTATARLTAPALHDATLKRMAGLGLTPLEAAADWRLVPAVWRDLLELQAGALRLSRVPAAGVGLSGPAGCGKTYTIAALLREYVACGINRTLNLNFGDVHWACWPWAIQHARGLAGQSQLEVNRWLTRMTGATMLCLDDVGAERTRQNIGEDFAIGMLDLIVDARARRGAVTLYTTNLNESELGKLYGSRIFSRLVGLNPLLRVTGGDRRRGMQG